MGTLERIQNAKRSSATDRAIAAYLLDHPEECTRISSRELARRTFTSATAVLRFCRKLGFENYNDFKVNIVSELKSVDFANTMIVEGESALGAMNKIAQLEAQVINETRRAASPEVLEAIARHLLDTRYIDILATDANSEMAHYASHNFFYMGRVCTVYDDLDKMIYLALDTPESHMAFLISKSGTDRTILTAARLFARRGVPTVAITANTDSPLAQACDYVLEGFYYPEVGRFGDLVFGASAKYLFDVLFVMLYARDARNIRALNAVYDDLYYSELDRAVKSDEDEKGVW